MAFNCNVVMTTADSKRYQREAFLHNFLPANFSFEGRCCTNWISKVLRSIRLRFNDETFYPLRKNQFSL
jgi:hypothetical protein